MPSLGADMTEGTLLEWLVHPGDVVHRGDIIAVVDTSKSAIDVEVFEEGRVVELLVQPGTTVPVGAPLARLDGVGVATDEGGRGPQPEATPKPKPKPKPKPEETLTPAPSPVPPAKEAARRAPAAQQHRDGSHIAASPFARRRAQELGVDLSTVVGHGGVISVADVEAAAGSGPSEAPPESVPPAQPPSAPAASDHAAAMRQAIGALMARSKREIPHYYLQTTIDMSAALDWLSGLNAERTVAERVLPAALLLKAVAVSARGMPDMNGFFVDGNFRPQDHVHVGVAVSLRGGGLIAPALHDADLASLDDLMPRMKDLVQRARSGRLRSSEMSDPTLTVTNLGEQGAELVHGVIYPPQVSLVGFGRIVERPIAVQGMLAVRPLLVATLAADHRVSDGHRGGLFLAAIDAALQSPENLQGGTS